MNTKKIIICSTSFIAFDRRMQRIAKALLDGGYSISWLGRTKDKDQIKLPYDWQIISPYFKRGILFYLEFNIRLFFRLLSNVKKDDIINSVDVDTLPACYFASKFKRGTLVFDSHEYFHEVPELTNRKLKKGIWRNIGKYFITRSKYNYTVNDSLAKEFQNLYNVPFEVIMNVPPLQEELVVPKQNKTLAYLGVLNAGRGLETAVEAMVELPDYRLWLLGDGDIRSDLEKLVSQHGLEDRVIFKGWVKPDEIAGLLAKASIGINLLDSVSESYRLSLANKFFDYVHLNLPSIHMAFPEYQRIIDLYPVGTTIKDLDPSQLIKAVKTLSQIENYEQSLKACQQARNAFNWENESKKLLEFYKNI